MKDLSRRDFLKGSLAVTTAAEVASIIAQRNAIKNMILESGVAKRAKVQDMSTLQRCYSA